MKVINIPLRDWFLLTLGTLLVSVGVYFFKFPNHFITGGVSGLSILLGNLLPFVTPGTLVLVFNLLFLIIGFMFISSDFGVRTVFCRLLFSLATAGLEWLLPLSAPLTDERFMELAFSVLLPSIGSAMLFNMGASTGGTDIGAMLLRKYTTIDIGRALMYTDFIIVLSSFFVFGIEIGLFSTLGLFLKSVLVDTVIENINRRKSLCIVTNQPEQVCDFIIQKLHRGATVWGATGSYTRHSVSVILTALNRYQAHEVQKYTKQIDANSFIIVTNTSEIYGKGFKHA